MFMGNVLILAVFGSHFDGFADRHMELKWPTH